LSQYADIGSSVMEKGMAVGTRLNVGEGDMVVVSIQNPT
jgi:hypothetical protein